MSISRDYGRELLELLYLERENRHMFLAPEPEIPEAVKDLLYSQQARVGCNDPIEASRFIAESDRRVLEAYRRGKGSK